MGFPLAKGDDSTRVSLTAALGLELLDVDLELVEVLDPVVADADAADFAFVDGLDESLPRALSPIGATIWAMKEDEINVFEPEFLQRGCDGFLGSLVACQWC